MSDKLIHNIARHILFEQLSRRGECLGSYLKLNTPNPIDPTTPVGVPLEIVGIGMGSKHITYDVKGWDQIKEEDDQYFILKGNFEASTRTLLNWAPRPPSITSQLFVIRKSDVDYTRYLTLDSQGAISEGSFLWSLAEDAWQEVVEYDCEPDAYDEVSEEEVDRHGLPVCWVEEESFPAKDKAQEEERNKVFDTDSHGNWPRLIVGGSDGQPNDEAITCDFCEESFYRYESYYEKDGIVKCLYCKEAEITSQSADEEKPEIWTEAHLRDAAFRRCEKCWKEDKAQEEGEAKKRGY